jgi:hypothetical protein
MTTYRYLSSENGWDIFSLGRKCYAIEGKSTRNRRVSHLETFTTMDAARKRARSLPHPRTYFTGSAWVRKDD